MSHENARFRARYWPVLIARAAIAAIAALVVTFSLDHSPKLGLFVFAGFAAATGLVVILGRARAGAARSSAIQSLTSGLVSAVFGVGSFAMALVAPSLGALVLALAAWGAINGVLEITLGIRREDSAAVARDRFIVGGITVLTAVVALLGSGDSVFVVGVFGAYAAIIAVYLGIAAFSLKWDAVASEPQRSAAGS